MANYDDYQLEELENSAVNKSTIAKRAVVGAGLLGAGAVSAFGAESLINEGDTGAELSEDDMEAGANAGAVSESTVEENPQDTHNTEEVHVYHHHVVEPPTPEPEPEPELEIETTTHLYDDDGNLVGTIDGGTYDDKDFAIVDVDGDGRGDYLMYDANGNGVFEDNEMADISDSNYIMGQGDEHRDVNIYTGEEIADAHDTDGLPDDIYVHDKDDDIADIKNDFTDEKSGEEYHGDLAENNQDYQNDGDIEHYNASMDSGETEHDEELLAYEEEDVDSYDVDGMPNPDCDTEEYEAGYADATPDDLSSEEDQNDYAYGDEDNSDDFSAHYDDSADLV